VINGQLALGNTGKETWGLSWELHRRAVLHTDGDRGEGCQCPSVVWIGDGGTILWRWDSTGAAEKSAGGFSTGLEGRWQDDKTPKFN
jgi:hypothetical protein